MTASQHLQIVNPCYSRGEDVLFGQFLILPAELRLRIWQVAVEQHRLLEVEIEPPSDSGDAPPYSTINALNNLISGRNYFATVQGYQLHSKLLYINRESREVALRFYRVHIPCYLQSSKDGIERTIRATLYFNPEYDFIHLRARGPEHPFVDFLHDLKAYDPQDVGLLNLALDTNSMNHLYSLTNVSEAAARASLVAFFIAIAAAHLDSPFSRWARDHGTVARFPRRRSPIQPLDAQLMCVLTAGSDPRQMRVQWRELLQRWEIRQVQSTRERVFFAYDPLSYEQQVYDIRTANKFLKEEEAKWLEAQQQWKGVVRKHAGKVPIEGPGKLAKAVRPAIGFWLFPAEALGGLDEDISGMKKVFDMTGHWPELALSCLS
ncbi:hypothetical protein G7Y89_g7399 [Cudoniella acicularis]|uniref:2EXR domain-containing protein n=1 Tax=Cudoniella acicularis TaxID=354080 RepID=A0A8H4RM56_9HELO|nr:hypothetical protein G7Y89_g7399 [Cudoniella acicularis]